jgi:hypothetical protein
MQVTVKCAERQYLAVAARAALEVRADRKLTDA